MVQLRHYPLKFAIKVVESIPSFKFLAKEARKVSEARLNVLRFPHNHHRVLHCTQPSSRTLTVPTLQVGGLLAWRFEDKVWPTGHDQWPEAQLGSVMFYLRRSNLVSLPEEFKGLIPKNEEEAKLLRTSKAM